MFNLKYYRDHHKKRIAIISKNKEELLESLEKLIDNKGLLEKRINKVIIISGRIVNIDDEILYNNNTVSEALDYVANKSDYTDFKKRERKVIESLPTYRFNRINLWARSNTVMESVDNEYNEEKLFNDKIIETYDRLFNLQSNVFKVIDPSYPDDFNNDLNHYCCKIIKRTFNRLNSFILFYNIAGWPLRIQFFSIFFAL